jgi:hypothetical protein
MVPLDRFARARGLLLAGGLLVGTLILAAAVGRKAERAGLAEMGGGAVRHPGDKAEQQIRALLDRSSRKRHLVGELLAGRLTLLEAAGQFRAVNRAPPRFHWEGFRAFYQGDSDEERHCREVVALVEMELEETDPCLRLATGARLVCELETRLRRGRLCLPEVPDP